MDWKSHKIHKARLFEFRPPRSFRGGLFLRALLNKFPDILSDHELLHRCKLGHYHLETEKRVEHNYYVP